MSEPPRNRYRQHLEIETPEHVVLDYDVAGIGSRALAKFLDVLILAAIGLTLFLAFSFWYGVSTWLGALQILAGFAVLWGYFTFFEGLRDGRTPGKRWMGIRAIRDTGHGLSLSDAALRNLLLPADLFGLIGAISIGLHPRAKRLGDLVAGTVVVRDHPTRRSLAPESALPEGNAAPELGDPEFRLLREFIQRAPELPREAAERHTRALLLRFAPRFPDRSGEGLEFLRALYRDEMARRQGRFGTRAVPLVAQRGEKAQPPARPGGSAERMVARKSDRWAAFQQMAERVTRNGLDSLAPAELPDFAGRYREVAADLARARTYGADSNTRARLERLVAAGHNALYRSSRHTLRQAADFILRQCPAAVVEGGRAVALAGVLFLAAAAAGYGLIRERPELAPELLPDVLLERAEAGRERTAAGLGYVVAERAARPIVASSIITNNVQVAFQCFAGGVFLGVGALVMLAFNGVFLGAVSGHFANAGLLGYLWTFVVGHSVLELFAIWVAGAAGFLLGFAIIAPGELARGDALVLAGRRAVRMVVAATLMLGLAGIIEGFVSAGEFALSLRLAVSAASVVLLALYLFNGRASRSR